MKTSSWKTTAAGLSAIIASVAGALNLLFDANPNTNPDWTALIAAVGAGIGAGGVGAAIGQLFGKH